MQCKKKHLYCEQWKMLRSRPFSTNPFRLHLSREKMLFLVENYGTCHTMECVLGKFHWILRKTIFTLYFLEKFLSSWNGWRLSHQHPTPIFTWANKRYDLICAKYCFICPKEKNIKETSKDLFWFSFFLSESNNLKLGKDKVYILD